MNLSQYAIKKGLNLNEYKQLKINIESIATAIISNIKTLHKIDTGLYYPVGEIINPIERTDIVPYIIQELKKQGVEFRENNTLYRY